VARWRDGPMEGGKGRAERRAEVIGITRFRCWLDSHVRLTTQIWLLPLSFLVHDPLAGGSFAS
jgi:hypothetical protein